MKSVAAQRIKARLEALGLSPSRASTLAGLGRDTVRSILRRPNDSPRAGTLAALAPVLGRSVDWLAGASDDEANPFEASVSVDKAAARGTLSEPVHFQFDGQRPAPARPTRPRPPAVPAPPRWDDRFLTLQGRAAAGLWVEDDTTPDEAAAAPVTFDPRWPAASQYALELTGDSLDLVYPPGALVHVVTRDAYGALVRTGDLVVLVRRRGDLVERSVKELRADAAGRLQAWPRSSNPRWAGPVDLAADLDDGDTVSIEGVVVGAYLPRR